MRERGGFQPELVNVRRLLPQINSDIDLLVKAIHKLQKEGRYDIRMTLPRNQGRITKTVEKVKL